jgi:hypothetical protein
MFVFSLFFLLYRTKICSSTEIDKDGLVSKVVATSFLISCVRLNEIVQKWVFCRHKGWARSSAFRFLRKNAMR